jgi:diadenosine tetraphosphate (Ap4A) HIT family hydrolase
MDHNCPFCDPKIIGQSAAENETVFAIADKYPATPGHLLIIPRRHTPDYFTMTSQERKDAEELIRVLRNKAMEDDPSILGFNVGVNCGEVAGQTIMHAHIHLIPRRQGDTETPRGGVRGVIPGKMSY